VCSLLGATVAFVGGRIRQLAMQKMQKPQTSNKVRKAFLLKEWPRIVTHCWKLALPNSSQSTYYLLHEFQSWAWGSWGIGQHPLHLRSDVFPLSQPDVK